VLATGALWHRARHGRNDIDGLGWHLRPYRRDDGGTVKRLGTKDPMGGHVRLYWRMLDSPAWRALSHADVRVYLAMRRKLLGSNNGDINATLAEMKHAGISSSSTLATALHRLEALGFIEKTRQGGIAAGGKLCCLYRFTDQPTFDIARIGVRASNASHEWQRFKTLAEATAAVLGFKRKNAPKVRPSERIDSTIELRTAFAASTIEVAKKVAVRSSKLASKGQTAPQPA
jgi:hypothetical protein